MHELKLLKEEKTFQDSLKAEREKVEEELKCIRDAQDGVLQAEKELCEKRNDEETLRCQRHAKEIIDEANKVKETIILEKEAHEEWIKNSKLSHQRELIEERERAANAMKDDREKHVLHLAREKRNIEKCWNPYR